MSTVRRPFDELLCAVVDNRGRSCPTAEIGLPLIATNCVKNDGLYPVKEKVRYVDDETYRTWFRAHPLPGDILFVCKGTPGTVALVPDPVDFCIAQDMVAVRANPAEIYPSYLFAALRSRDAQDQVAAMHVGTLIPHFKKGEFRRLMIPLPPTSEQHHIGDTYVALSKKIEAGRRTRRLLDDLVRTEVEACRESASTRDMRLDDLVERVAESVDPSGGASPYIGLEHMPRGHLFLDSWDSNRSLASTKLRFDRGDILFGKLRPYFMKVGIAPLAGICSTDMLVFRPKVAGLRSLILAECGSEAFINFASATAGGTRMPRTSWDDLRTWPVEVPSDRELAELDASTGPLIDLGVALVHQERTLAALRDAWLEEMMHRAVNVANEIAHAGAVE